MPVILRKDRVLYLFYANEFYATKGAPREPPHIHAIKNGIDAKFWLGPPVKMAYNDGHDARTLRQMVQTVEANAVFFMEAWSEFFQS